MTAKSWSMTLGCGSTARVWIHDGQIHLEAPKQMSAVDATRLGMGLAEAAKQLAQRPPKRPGEKAPSSVSDFSELACKRCGTKHRLDQFDVGHRVAVIADGLVGAVTDWTQYGCPLMVRVRLDGANCDDEFDPCELRTEP